MSGRKKTVTAKRQLRSYESILSFHVLRAEPGAEEVKPQFDPEQVQTETAESQPEPEQTLPAKTQEAPAEEKQPLELFSAFTDAEGDPIPEAVFLLPVLPASLLGASVPARAVILPSPSEPVPDQTGA